METLIDMINRDERTAATGDQEDVTARRISYITIHPEEGDWKATG